jgi:hypothetical protein
MRKKIIWTLVSILIIIGIYLSHYAIFSYFYLKHCIVWKKDLHMKYQDFQDDPDYDSDMDIVYWHGLYLTSRPYKKAEVVAVFDKNESWVKDTTKFNFQELLTIQKIAFDLTECYARKCNKEIERKGYDENGNQKPFKYLKEIKDSIYDEYINTRNELFNDDTKTVTQLIESSKPKVDKMLMEK